MAQNSTGIGREQAAAIGGHPGRDGAGGDPARSGERPGGGGRAPVRGGRGGRPLGPGGLPPTPDRGIAGAGAAADGVRTASGRAEAESAGSPTAVPLVGEARTAPPCGMASGGGPGDGEPGRGVLPGPVEPPGRLAGRPRLVRAGSYLSILVPRFRGDRACHTCENFQKGWTSTGRPVKIFPARLLKSATGRQSPDRKSTRLNSSHLGISYA